MVSVSKKVLIVGIKSFTGKYLEDELHAHGYDVYGCDIIQGNDSHYYKCDITKKNELIEIINSVKPNYIVHLVAISFVPHAEISEIYNINLFGTLNLLDAVLETNCSIQKILIVSSGNVYGEPAIEYIDENIRPKPVSHYANSKLAMEHMVNTYCDILPLIITRPFNYTGKNQHVKFLIPKIISHFRDKKETIELGNLGIVRDFSDVRFVTNAYRRLLESSATSETVNICSGYGIALTDIISYACNIAGYHIKVEVNPEFLRKNEIKTLIGVNHKLMSLIGKIDPIPIKETLRWMMID